MDPFPRTRLTGAFERRVAAAIDASVPRAQPVVVACSGGPDSTAALIAATRSGRPVIAAHFDHQLRTLEEARSDAEAVRAVAASLRTPLRCGAGSGSATSEDAARGERYRWLAAVATEGHLRACVTGHTLDDQAETVLLHLVRGAGASGAAGMAPVAAWPVDAPGAEALKLVRPLLRITRTQVEAYLAALGVEARIDPTNADPHFSRNRIRSRVMPELRALNPRAAHALSDYADRARLDEAALERWAREVFAAGSRRDGDTVTLDRASLRALPDAVSARVIRMAAVTLGLALDAAQTRASVRALSRAGMEVALRGGRVIGGTGALQVTRAPEGT